MGQDSKRFGAARSLERPPQLFVDLPQTYISFFSDIPSIAWVASQPFHQMEYTFALALLFG